MSDPRQEALAPLHNQQPLLDDEPTLLTVAESTYKQAAARAQQHLLMARISERQGAASKTNRRKFEKQRTIELDAMYAQLAIKAFLSDIIIEERKKKADAYKPKLKKKH